MWALGLASVAGALALRAQVAPAAQASAGPQVRVAFAQALPALDGKNLKVQGVEVRYAPGGQSQAHSHPCPVIGYVLEGAYRSQVEGQPEAIYKEGESFYEAPNGVHVVSANASATEPVRFLAFFVCDHDVELSVPVGEHSGRNGGGRKS